ncbi:MAG: ankyrin repeat domain-containing protein, partial [Anaerolineales bacterium]
MMKNHKLLIPLIITIAFVGCQSGENKSPAKKAVRDQEVAQAKKQLEELGIKISDQSLLEMAEKGETETVSLLLKAGVSPDVTDNNNNSPLIIATNWGNTETAIVLIEAGADLNLSGQRGKTALMAATIRGNMELLNALI